LHFFHIGFVWLDAHQNLERGADLDLGELLHCAASIEAAVALCTHVTASTCA